MPAPTSSDELIELIRRSGVVAEPRLSEYLQSTALPTNPEDCADQLIRDAIITPFQARQFLQGRYKRFVIAGKYRLLDLLGAGGMGAVYLCEHSFMRRLVALKVLPTDKLNEESSVERFYLEARAAAALDHPNIVRAYDIDRHDNMCFYVMEYVEGSSLQEIVSKFGPLSVDRVTHYIAQTALGLQHAHDQRRLVHRDIKPGNLLLDRHGTIKILDMGLARFFGSKESITEKYDEKGVLGTADYLAPEQALDSNVDIRADIYSLGCTMYFLLTGHAPFEEGTITQKLLWHRNREPKPVSEYRSDVPAELLAVLAKMTAKSPQRRYQLPVEVAEALRPWTQTPPDPPPEREMPYLCPAVRLIARGTDQPEPIEPTVSPMRAAVAAPATPRPNVPISPPPYIPNAYPTSPVSPSRTDPMAVNPAAGLYPTVAVDAVARMRPSTLPPPRSTAPISANAQTMPLPVASPPAAAVGRPPLKVGLIMLITLGTVALVLLGSIITLIFFSGSQSNSSKSDLTNSTPTGPVKVGSGPRDELILSPAEAVRYAGKPDEITLEMKVNSTGSDGTKGFLNSNKDYRAEDNFVVMLSESVVNQLKAKPQTRDPIGYFKDKTIRVRGRVVLYENRKLNRDVPEIIVERLDQFITPRFD